jgi:ribosome-associated translation inhibitor RaiA
MIVEVSSKRMSISPPSMDLINLYTGRLDRYFRRIYSVRWMLEPFQKSVTATLDVHARSGNYRASADGATVREVLVSACDLVERQRRHRKKSFKRSRHAASTQSRENQQNGKPVNDEVVAENFGV